MGIWKLLGRLIKVSDKDTWLVPSESAGRLIYEQFDTEAGKSSEKSQFYIIKYAKLLPRRSSDSAEIQAEIQLDMSDLEMVEPFTED